MGAEHPPAISSYLGTGMLYYNDHDKYTLATPQLIVFTAFPISYRLCMFWTLGQKMAEQVSNTQDYTGLEN